MTKRLMILFSFFLMGTLQANINSTPRNSENDTRAVDSMHDSRLENNNPEDETNTKRTNSNLQHTPATNQGDNLNANPNF
jgi:hypothetical protein